MEKMILEDFIKYAKEQFDCDIYVKTSDMPDTFASVFGGSFLNNVEGAEKVNDFDLSYDNTSINVQFVTDDVMCDVYSSNVGLAA